MQTKRTIIDESAINNFTEKNSVSSKKFNLKVSSEDIDFIEFYSENNKTTKSSLLNEAIDDILKNEIDSISNLDAKLLIAKYADESCANSNKEEPGRWTVWVLRKEIQYLQENFLRWNSAEAKIPGMHVEEGTTRTNSDEFEHIFQALYGSEK